MKKGNLRDKVGKGKLTKELRNLIVAVVLEIIVAGLAIGIVGRFFPGHAYIYDAIMISFVGAVGITIIIYGNAKRNRYVNVVGFLVVLFGMYIMIEIYEGFAVKISAFATLAVAIAAFAAIEENRRMRLERRDQEQEVQKEKMLGEINDWGTKVLNSMLIASRHDKSVPEYKKTMSDCQHALMISMAESYRVRAICKNLSLKTGISDSDGERIKESVELVWRSTYSFVGTLLGLDIENLKEDDVRTVVEGAQSISHEVRSLLELMSEVAVG